MQPNTPPAAEGIRSSAPYQQGVQDDAFAAQSAEIISLFDEQSAETAETGDKSKKNTGRLAQKPRSKRIHNKNDASNVVYIRRSPAE